MRSTISILVCWLFIGCSKEADDRRLQGSWRLNRDGTVTGLLEQDPDWANTSPEHAERVRKMLRPRTITFSKGIMTVSEEGDQGSRPYHVITQGSDYVSLRIGYHETKEAYDIRIRFVDGHASFWLESPSKDRVPQKFDRI